MGKRKNGEGTYGTCKRRNTTYRYYKFPNGHFIYAKTAADLEKKKKEYQETEVDVMTQEKLFGDPRNTVSDYCNTWLRSKRGEITPRVYDEYEEVIKNRIATYDIGNEQMSHLSPSIVNEYLMELATKYSRASIDRVWTILRQVVDYALSNRVLKSFDKTKVKKPKEEVVKVKKKDVPFITEEDMEILLEESQTGKYGNAAKLVAFIMYSGLRVSEACALEWENVAKDYTFIRVKKSQTYVKVRDSKGKILLNEDGKEQRMLVDKGTKTKSGDRTVPIPPQGQRILQELDTENRSGNVFKTAKSKPFTKDLARKTLVRMLDNSNVSNKEYTLHSLRHGYGSLLLKKGVDIKIISELLGHSDVTTTYNIYIGVLKQDKIDAVMNAFS